MKKSHLPILALVCLFNVVSLVASAQCFIRVEHINRESATSNTITVQGTSEGCPSVNVQWTNPALPAKTATVNQFATGLDTWSVTYSAADGLTADMLNNFFKCDANNFQLSVRCGQRQCNVTYPDNFRVHCKTQTNSPCPPQLTLRANRGNTEVDTDNCVAPGDYTVELVESLPAGAVVSWSVDGIHQQSATGTSFAVTLAAGEEKQISVSIYAGPQCLRSSAVNLEACRCAITDIEIESGRCDTLTGRVSVVIQSSLTGTPGSAMTGTMVLRNADGATLATDTDQENDGSMILSVNTDLRDGSYNVTVTLTDPSGCDETMQRSFDIANCQIRNRNDEEEPITDGSGGWCLAWMWFNIFLIVGSAFALFAAVCSPSPVTIGIAIGAIALTLASIALWLAICPDWMMCGDQCWCDLLRLFLTILSIIEMVAIIVAIILSVMGNVCVIAAWVDVGYIGTILAAGYLVAELAGCV